MHDSDFEKTYRLVFANCAAVRDNQTRLHPFLFQAFHQTCSDYFSQIQKPKIQSVVSANKPPRRQIFSFLISDPQNVFIPPL